MASSNPYNAYKQNSVKMASKQQLLLMLVDGAVKYTKIARLAIEKKDKIKKAYATLCASENFQRTLSGGLQNKGAIIRRREEWNSLLKEAVDGI